MQDALPLESWGMNKSRIGQQSLMVRLFALKKVAFRGDE
jgi:hypothetical protein